MLGATGASDTKPLRPPNRERTTAPEFIDEMPIVGLYILAVSAPFLPLQTGHSVPHLALYSPHSPALSFLQSPGWAVYW